MDLYETMRTAATTRLFDTDAPVDDEVLERILDSARFAPNGGNRQGWRVVVVRDPQLRARLAELYRDPWARYLREHHGREVPDVSETPLDRFVESLGDIGVHVLFWVRLDALALTDAALDRVSIVGGASVYPFVQNFLLGCRNEGLGAAMTTMLVSNEPAVRELVGAPEDFALACHVPVGWPAGPMPQRLRRAPVEEFVCRDRFDTPW